MSFLNQEDGAVTVDWVVLTAAMVGLGIVAVQQVQVGNQSLADSIGNTLSDATVASLAAPVEIMGFDWSFAGVIGRIDGRQSFAVNFAMDSFAEGLSHLTELSTSAVMDWGRHGQHMDPYAIGFGDPASRIGGPGSVLRAGLTAQFDPAANTTSIFWHGDLLATQPAPVNMVNMGATQLGVTVSDAGQVNVTGFGQTLATASIAGTEWADTPQTDWSVSHAANNSSNLSWMYTRDATLSGSGY